MTDLNPFDPAKQDVRNIVTRAHNKAQDLAKTYITAALTKTLGTYAIGIGAAVYMLPVAAWITIVVALVVAAVWAIYATKIMKAQDREHRWGYVGAKRVQQRNVEAEIAMHTATLALMGERHAPAAMRGATPELKAALAFNRHRLRLAEERADAAEAVKDGTATDTQRRALARFRRQSGAVPPKGPAVEPIKARRAALYAERAELEAEIKSLSTADSIAAAMQAEEVQGARRTRKERQDAARKADQAARERVRAGKEPTRSEPEHVLALRIGANGDRDVSSGRGALTPEQIARR